MDCDDAKLYDALTKQGAKEGWSGLGLRGWVFPLFLSRRSVILVAHQSSPVASKHPKRVKHLRSTANLARVLCWIVLCFQP